MGCIARSVGCTTTASLLLLVAMSLSPTAEAADLQVDFVLPAPPGDFVGPAAEPSAFRVGEPVVATSYFYWYDNATKAHVINHDGTDALTDHPPTLDGLSYKSVDWHAAQLVDMMAAGIDVALPVYWGEPTEVSQWSNEGLPPLVAARQRLLDQGETPPAIGMFYDTTTLLHNTRHVHVDLTTPQGRLWFYGTIRDCFSLIPPRHRATIDGRPLVFLYARAFAMDVDQRLFPAVREMFRKDFGTDLYLVKMRGWPGEADSEYQWGGALHPQLLETAGIGPGYDHSAVPGRTPLVRERDDGRFYRFSWERLLDIEPDRRPWLVHLETWNEYHEGTEICETKEYGRQYLDLTRHYVDIFHRKGRLDPADRMPPIAEIWATADDSRGLVVHVDPGGDGLVEVAEHDGSQVWRTRPNRHSGIRYIYFDADYSFLFDGDETVAVVVEYLDSSSGALRLEYDSADPAVAGIMQAFRPAGSQEVTDSGQWRTARFELPRARFAGRANGADFRFGSATDSLTIRRVVVQRGGD